MTTFLIDLLAIAALAAGPDSHGPAASAEVVAPAPLPSETWTIRGRVMVRHMMPELAGLAPSGSPLKNLKVKVSAKEKVLGVWGWYNGWETITTDAQGYFSITRSLSGNDRRFKVEVQFEDDGDLELRHEDSTSSLTKVKWYKVYESSTARSPGNINLGTFTFDAGAGLELDDSEPRHHADIWVLAQKAMEQLASYGSSFEFDGQVKIKYPHDSGFGAVEASYANPYTRVIYIQEDDFDAATILHEMMHVWSYDHGTGESILAETLAAKRTTHGSTNAPVAFLEGFAEYSARELMTLLFGEAEQLPFNRYHLSDELGLSNVARVQLHDDGWRSLLAAMTCSDLFMRDFLEAGEWNASNDALRLTIVAIPWGASADVPDLDFEDILRVFNARSSAGYDAIAFRDVTMTAFLSRAAGILSAMSSDDADRFRYVINPAGTQQPHQLFLQY